jgi:hypothetical protein
MPAGYMLFAHFPILSSTGKIKNIDQALSVTWGKSGTVSWFQHFSNTLKASRSLHNILKIVQSILKNSFVFLSFLLDPWLTSLGSSRNQRHTILLYLNPLLTGTIEKTFSCPCTIHDSVLYFPPKKIATDSQKKIATDEVFHTTTVGLSLRFPNIPCALKPNGRQKICFGYTTRSPSQSLCVTDWLIRPQFRLSTIWQYSR